MVISQLSLALACMYAGPPVTKEVQRNVEMHLGIERIKEQYGFEAPPHIYDILCSNLLFSRWQSGFTEGLFLIRNEAAPHVPLLTRY